MGHELIGKKRIVADDVDLVAAGGMNDIIDGDIPVK